MESRMMRGVRCGWVVKGKCDEKKEYKAISKGEKEDAKRGGGFVYGLGERGGGSSEYIKERKTYRWLIHSPNTGWRNARENLVGLYVPIEDSRRRWFAARCRRSRTAVNCY